MFSFPPTNPFWLTTVVCLDVNACFVYIYRWANYILIEVASHYHWLFRHGLDVVVGNSYNMPPLCFFRHQKRWSNRTNMSNSRACGRVTLKCISVVVFVCDRRKKKHEWGRLLCAISTYLSTLYDIYTNVYECVAYPILSDQQCLPRFYIVLFNNTLSGWQ